MGKCSTGSKAVLLVKSSSTTRTALIPLCFSGFHLGLGSSTTRTTRTVLITKEKFGDSRFYELEPLEPSGSQESST